ncbi:DUF1206 domain-containing protein [Actinokineospora sp.]|uniref:DUF1206 domain-containing protein n=1 Tax=Actinokineospora sp. TaxID=1872133 RepID=UPI0040378996
MTSAVGAAGRRAQNHDAVKVLGRAGMVCFGAVYIIVAYLAVRIAIGSDSQEADQTGALAEIATTTFGVAVLWVLGVGLFAFGLWQLLMAAVSYRWVDKTYKRTLKRASAAVRGVVGISLGIASVRIAAGAGGGSGGDQNQQELTARVMALPAGRVVVGLVALAVIGVGVASISSGVRKSFMKDLDSSDLPSGSRTLVERLGMIGHIAKGVGIGIIGGLLGTAALDADPGEAGGLDLALRTLADRPFGSILLVAVALGFAAFGAYCFAAARAHRT